MNVNGPVDWAKVFEGRGPESETWAEREAARIRANEPDRRAFDDAYSDESTWPTDADGRRFDPLAEQRRLAGQGWTGQVFGGAGPCPQCQAEERGGAVIDRVNHEHWLSDRRLEERLKDAARISRAEADGGIRIGGRMGDDRILRR